MSTAQTPRIESTTTTTDDTTWVALLQIPLATAASYAGLLFMVVFRDAATGNGGHRIAVGSVRNVSGTLTSVGAVNVQSSSDTGLTAATLRNTVSGTNLLIEVRGANGVTLNWFGGILDSSFSIP